MELSSSQTLQKAVEAQKAGRLDEASQLYSSILKSDPKNANANLTWV